MPTVLQNQSFASLAAVAAGAAGSTTGSGPLGWIDQHGGIASIAGGRLTITADGADGSSYGRDFVYDPTNLSTGQRIDILIPPGAINGGGSSPQTAVDLLLRRQANGQAYLAAWSIVGGGNPTLQFFALNSGGSATPLGNAVACTAYDPTHYYRLTAYDAATTASTITLILTDHGTANPVATPTPLYNLDGNGTVAGQILALADNTPGLQAGGSLGLDIHPAGGANGVSFGVIQVTTASTAGSGVTPTPTPTGTSLTPGTLAVSPGNPASSCLTITQGTGASGGTAPYSIAGIWRTFDGGTTYAPLPPPSTAYPVYDSEIAPRTTVGYRALVLDSAGLASWTATVTATTIAPSGAQTKLLVCGIDSKTNGYGSSPQMGGIASPVNSGTSTPAWLGMLLGDTWDVENVGEDGQTIPQAMSANREAAYLNPTKYTSGQFFLLFGGCNDLRGGLTGAQTYANLKTYATAKTAQGFKVIVCTNPDNIDPSSSYTTAAQDAYNALIRAGWQADLGAVALCDYASSNIFGLDGTTSRADHANYWWTGDAPKVEHYNDRGYLELAKFAAAVIAQAVTPATVIMTAPTTAGPTVDEISEAVWTFSQRSLTTINLSPSSNNMMSSARRVGPAAANATAQRH